MEPVVLDCNGSTGWQWLALVALVGTGWQWLALVGNGGTGWQWWHWLE